MADIVLIKPPRDADMASRIGLPMSLAYLAGSLRERFGVRVLDLQFFQYEQPGVGVDPDWARELRQVILEEQPGLVGITCLFSGDIDKVLAIAEAVKAMTPTAKTVIGGVHPTIFGRDILANCPFVDFVVKGEGDVSTAELAEGVMAGRDDFSHIDGLFWRNAAGEIVEQQKTGYIEDLDSLPRPAYDLFPVGDYPNPGSLPNPKNRRFQTNFPLLTSRSCGRVCNFCSLHNAMGRKARMHSAARVLDELEYLHDTYGMTYFDIEDDNFTLSKSRTLDICAGIRQRGLDIQFRLRNGVHIPTIDAEVAGALADAGLAAVYLAIESGSEFIRNRVIGKNVPTEKIHEAAAAFARHPQVTTGAFIIIGMPEETPETAEETLDLLRNLDIDTFFFMPADELLGYSRQLEILQSDMKYRSLLRKNREAAARLPARVEELLLRQNGTHRPLYLFGAGSLGRLMAAHFAGDFAIRGFLDNNRDLWGRTVEDLKVIPAGSDTLTGEDAAVVICVLNRLDAEAVRRQLTNAGVRHTLSLAEELYGLKKESRE